MSAHPTTTDRAAVPAASGTAALSTATLDTALTTALATVRRNIASFAETYPDDCTVAGRYPPRPARGAGPAGANVGWTTGFWPGMLWLAHAATGDEVFARAGRQQVLAFDRRVRAGLDLETHDLGFLYTLSCVAPWRSDPSDEVREIARAAGVLAAEHLMRRFLEPAGIIQAWGDLDDPDQRGRTIIDSLLNLPLLHWAAGVTGRAEPAEAAHRHAIALRDSIIRDDGTTFHTFTWDAVTGEPRRGTTQQGFSDSSCWARGQAWGILGFALARRHTGDVTMTEAARRCAGRFLAGLPADGIPYWDLVFGDGSAEPRDTSAAAVAVCGLLELADQVDPASAARYRDEGDRILLELVRRHAPGPGADALLLDAVYDRPRGIGVGEGCLWGDHFYLEALLRRLRPDLGTAW